MNPADDIILGARKSAVHPGTALLCSGAEKIEIELRNQDELTEYVERQYREVFTGDRFSLTLVRDLHSITLAGVYPSAGQFRKAGDEVDIKGATFEPAPGYEVVPRIQDLCDRMNRQAEGPASVPDQLEAVAKFFHEYLAIHPFLDGNGRTARALLHLMLYEYGILSPPEQIYDYIERWRDEYYQALAAADSGNFDPLLKYLALAVADWLLQRSFDLILRSSFAEFYTSRLDSDQRNFMNRRNRWRFSHEERAKRARKIQKRILQINQRFRSAPIGELARYAALDRNG